MWAISLIGAVGSASHSSIREASFNSHGDDTVDLLHVRYLPHMIVYAGGKFARLIMCSLYSDNVLIHHYKFCNRITLMPHGF